MSKEKKSILQRLASASLSALLVLSMVPTAAFADAGTQAPSEKIASAQSDQVSQADDESQNAPSADDLPAAMPAGDEEVIAADPVVSAVVEPADEDAVTEPDNPHANSPPAEDEPQKPASPVAHKGAGGLAAGGYDLSDLGTIVPTPVGNVPLSIVKQYADARDARKALYGSNDAGLSTLSVDGELSALSANNFDYRGVCSVVFRNASVTDDVFTVTIGGVDYTGYCQDEGLPAPEDGDYYYWAEYESEYSRYKITVDCSGADVHWNQYDTGYGCQEVGGFYVYTEGYFTLTKECDGGYSFTPTGIYSVAGAQYGLYYYRADAETCATPNYTLTIGEDGKSETTYIGFPGDGNWYVRELSAPAGYLLDPEVHHVVIAPTQITSNSTATVYEKPIMDPAAVSVTKVNAAGERVNTETLSLAGAEYTFYYFAGDFNSLAEAQASGVATRSWTFKTILIGGKYQAGILVYELDNSTLVSGDPFYYDAAGLISIPLGTLIVKETKAPYGYNLSGKEYVSKLVADSSNYAGCSWVGAVNPKDGNTEIVDTETIDYGALVVQKVSTNADITAGNPNYSLAGAVFEIYDNADCSGSPKYTLTTGADGKTDAVKKLVPGSEWWVKEVKAPAGFELPPANQRVKKAPSIKAGVEGETVFAYGDAPKTGGIQVVKVSAEPDRTQGNPNYSLAGAVFDIYEGASATGSPKYTLTTGADGKTEVIDGLAIGSQWTVKEKAAPANYKLATATETITVVEQVVTSATIEEEIITGSGSLIKRSANGGITDGNDMYSLAGAIYGMWDNAECAGEPFAKLSTNEAGVTNKVDDLLIGSVWYVKEIKVPAGYKLDTNVYRMEIETSEEVVVEVEEAPVYTDANVSVIKVDAQGNEVPMLGSATLEGAVYEFKFFAGKSAGEINGATPDAVWEAATNAEGVATLEGATLVSGHSWMSDGKNVLPLGTLVVKEKSASHGFLVSEEEFVSSVIYDADAQAAVWEGAVADSNKVNEDGRIVAEEDKMLFGISLFKEIQGVDNETSPEGITFEIVYVGEGADNGTVYATLVLDETGNATTGEYALPLGTYEVREVEESLPRDKDGNYLIQPYSHTSTDEGTNLVATVEAEDLATFPLYEVVQTGCVDYTSENPKIHKEDIDTHEPISNVEFTLYRYTGELGMNDGAIAADPATLSAFESYWEEIDAIRTDAHGVADFGNRAYGIYMTVETEAEYRYMAHSESDADGTDADPRQTARIFKMDKNTPAEIQQWEDTAIQIECTVDKNTIDVTSAGFEYDTSSDDDADHKSNVGVEEYRYDVDFSNGATNTYADEFWVVDELNMTASPYDLRVTRIATPIVQNDTDGEMALLVRTNKSGGETYAGRSAQPELHEHTTLCTENRFDGTGWRFVGTYSATASTTLEVASLGLAEDEYLTGIALLYGAVEKDFASTTPLTYMVRATHSLAEGVVLPNTATSHITRNWAPRLGSVGGLSDDDEDRVETTVIGTFVQTWDKYIIHGGAGSILPQMGDNMMVFVYIMLCLLVVSGVALLIARRKKGASEEKPMKKNVKYIIIAALVVLALAIAGFVASCQSSTAASSSASASASATAAASSSASAQAASSASASSSVSEDSQNEGSALADGSAGSSGTGGNSTGGDTGSPSTGTTGGSPAAPEPAPNPPSTPAHEHSWTWVPNIETVVVKDAWDEVVYRWASWCPKCNCEVSRTHPLETGEGHSVASVQLPDYTIHHDAETREVDNGHYQCTGCGVWQ